MVSVLVLYGYDYKCHILHHFIQTGGGARGAMSCERWSVVCVCHCMCHLRFGAVVVACVVFRIGDLLLFPFAFIADDDVGLMAANAAGGGRLSSGEAKPEPEPTPCAGRAERRSGVECNREEDDDGDKEGYNDDDDNGVGAS